MASLLFGGLVCGILAKLKTPGKEQSFNSFLADLVKAMESIFNATSYSPLVEALLGILYTFSADLASSIASSAVVKGMFNQLSNLESSFLCWFLNDFFLSHSIIEWGTGNVRDPCDRRSRDAKPGKGFSDSIVDPLG